MFAKKRYMHMKTAMEIKELLLLSLIMMQREFSMRNIQNGKLLKMLPLIIGTMDRTYLKWIT